MSAQDQQRYESPLVSERGSTTVSDTVVATIAGRAAQEVAGVHMGGGASRAAGGILGSITGSESQTRGVSVQVGRVEAAIDLTMGIEYGRDILETVEEVRRRISERVQSMTGLRVTELNATVSDIVFPERGVGGRRILEDGSRTTQGASGPLAQERTRAGEGEETAESRPEEISKTRPTSEENATRRSEEK
jgi:uncharacterized alkaline shock family protein YloU